MGKKVLIIGGVACGGKTAARLMRIDPEAEVTILEKGKYLSYAGCGLPFYVGGVVKEYSDLMTTPIGIVRDENFFRKVKHINVHTSHMATKIDRKNHNVIAVDLTSGQEKNFSYDKLVIATGASPIRLPLPGSDLPEVFTLWTMSDALAMRAAIDSGKVKRAVIIGGGLIGMEVVEALCNRGLEVSVVDILDRPLPAMIDPAFGRYLLKALQSKGVHFYGEERVLEIVGHNGEVKSVKTDKREIPADMVLMAVGVRPNTAIAKDAGLEIGKSGGILVDEHMRTNDPDIYAGGDCVEVNHILTGRKTWQPMGSVANRQGRVIADNIAGIPSTFPGVAGTAIMRAFEYTIGKTGLTKEEAIKEGYDAEAVTIVNSDIPHFMPNSALITIRLVADKKTRRVLGAQVFGKGRADKRLDILVTAVTGGLTIDMLGNTDVAYAPPYSTALDPVTHAANALKNKMDNLMRSVSPLELKEKIEEGWNPLCVDVRTPEEIITQGQLPYDCVNIPLGLLWEKASELPKDRDIVTYCKISVRGWDAYSILRRRGFEKVFVLEGGIEGWPFELAK
ncbi:MAG: FAD-dependent oxidoreductase [Acetomicrobium sp.]|jgi:NADPH-dependent 2,4-dienoyl-CoA reductase/sulfur reductase-like enzyme/rhodanese-related sulfurtransferase|uniref:FAD-dependent oxidoreductase n=1 Tax=Acetomicrobium sp. TaxID=1872099 RepID=UPI002B2585E2|nr:FAD-dependent oxidoreductase [Acetomicrobium sp.]